MGYWCTQLRIILFVQMALFAPHLIAQFPSQPAVACKRNNLVRSIESEGYVFREYREPAGSACAEVLSAGRVIFRRTNDNDGRFYFGQKADKENGIPALAIGTDITGRGHPEMILSEYTGGAHCCLMHYVFELKPKFRLLATLDAEDDGLAHFAGLDRDGHYFYLAHDWTFAYWPQDFASSPVAPIVLRFVPERGGGSYHLALEKMVKPSPTKAEWTELESQSRHIFADGPPNFSVGEFWDIELKLLYSGRSEWAWKLLETTWPKTVPGMQEQLGEFCTRLKSSPYWADLKPSLKDVPPACARAKASAR